jgi:hypothetical protein
MLLALLRRDSLRWLAWPKLTEQCRSLAQVSEGWRRERDSSAFAEGFGGISSRIGAITP